MSAEPEQENGVGLIARERQRQIEVEGWTPEHDQHGGRDDLACAAACYALPEDLREHASWWSPGQGRRLWRHPRWWPWEARYWKPTPDDRIRELVKAGALIAAEIDRLKAVS